MKTHTKVISMKTARREETLDITSLVSEALKESGVRDGLALVTPLHTSCAVYISDSDRGLQEDLTAILSTLIPEGKGYLHDRSDTKLNAHGHLRAVLAGHHVTVPVSEGRLELGSYGTIYYAEFDGQREKEILVKIIGQ